MSNCVLNFIILALIGRACAPQTPLSEELLLQYLSRCPCLPAGQISTS